MNFVYTVMVIIETFGKITIIHIIKQLHKMKHSKIEENFPAKVLNANF
jgi:hypothetical protein